jgi:PKD repeat protein
MKKLVLTLIAALVVAITFAQGWRTNEMEVKVNISSRQDAIQLTDLRLNGDYYEDYAILYLIPEELEMIKNKGLKFEVKIENLNEFYNDFWETREEYHSYQEIIDEADGLVANFPDICTKHIFGTSMGGRQLAALKISDNSAVDENEAEVMFDGGIHGDEIGGSENIIRFATDLCEAYGNDPDITGLIDNREIWLYLMVNPDGRVGMTRYNNNGVDLNRDWGYMWDEWGGSNGAFSQIESKVLRSCSYGNQFVIHTSYHSGTEYISCPWSYRASVPFDMDRILELAGLYSDVSGYADLEYGQGSSGMYFINGSTKDSNYGAMGSISWSMEISYDKQPPASQILTYYNYNVPSMLAIIEHSGYGIEGLVTDAVNGDPVAASIFVENYLPCFTDPEVGDFHKFLLPGNYDILVKANGYDDKLIVNVSVTAMNSTITNIELDPLDHHSIYRILSSQIPDNNPSDPGLTWNAIGQPDNMVYSIGKNGWVVVDMLDVIFDGAGPDIMVFEGDAVAEGYTLYAGESMDGPFYSMGTGSGTSEFDFSSCTLSEARYFKILDDGDGTATAMGAGFDLDAMQALSSITGPYIIMDGYVVDDSNGNNNGQLDPGETVDYTITLKNVGSAGAQAIVGSLSCIDQYVTVITTAQQTFGNISINESATATFTVSAESSAPAGHTAMMELAYEGDNVNPSSKYIEVLFPDYCYPSANCSYGDGLTGFVIADISNMNNGCSNDMGIDGYGDFTDLSTELEPGMTYSVGLETGYSDQDVSLWIDFDMDMAFEDSERLITDFNLANTGQLYNVNISIPEGVMPGPKRLRVRANWQNSSQDPCGTFSYGETEDYTVVITGNILNAAFTSDVTELCHGNEVEYYDNSIGNITTWDWEFPGGTPATSTEENPVVTYNSPGMYGVTLTVGDGSSTNTASMLEYVIVYNDPETPATPNGLEEMCQDSENCSYTTNNAAGATGWMWELEPANAGTLTILGPGVEIDWNPDFSGSVQLMAGCENMCGESDMSDPLEITILPFPGAAGEITGESQVCQEQVTAYIIPEIAGATFYDWSLDPIEAGVGESFGDEINITWSSSYEGTALLKVRGSNDCGDGAWSANFEVLVQNCVGLGNELLPNSFGIYPNPGTGTFTVDLGRNNPGSFKISIVNSLGSLVYNQDFNQTENQINVDLNNLPQGIYYLKLETNSSFGVKKIIIQQ